MSVAAVALRNSDRTGRLGESSSQAPEVPAGAAKARPVVDETAGRCAGLLLAAGAGRRFGRPKALVELDGEPLVRRAFRVLADGGCDPIRVVLGARAEDARGLLPDPMIAVYAEDWSTGMGASLRAGLRALVRDTAGKADPDTVRVDAVLVHLVDLPKVDARVISRLRALASPGVVARASYDGVPGHPVVFGHRWWTEIAGSAHGDRGARDWLATRRDLLLVDCSDLGGGADVDTPSDLAT
jgi:CTP:molybdopterin cytidylyltransferase MocA